MEHTAEIGAFRINDDGKKGLRFTIQNPPNYALGLDEETMGMLTDA